MPKIPSGPGESNGPLVDPSAEKALQAALNAAFDQALAAPGVPQPLKGFEHLTATLKARDPAPARLPHGLSLVQDPHADLQDLRREALLVAKTFEQVAPKCARALAADLPPGGSWAVRVEPAREHVVVYLIRDLRNGDARVEDAP